MSPGHLEVPIQLGPVGHTDKVRRAVVKGLAKIDEVLDEVLCRPAVVKAFTWLPRWWLCDLAKISMALDDRWRAGYWDHAAIAPGEACEACGRRASIHVVGGWADDPDLDEALDNDEPDFLAHRVVHLCGWCHIEGPIRSADDLKRELDAAARDSIAWRWRWRPSRD